MKKILVFTNLLFWVMVINNTIIAQNPEWIKSLGGTGYDNGTSIQQTSDGGYIYTGGTNSNDGNVSGNHPDLSGNNSNDVWVVKLDASGAITWQKSLGGSGFDLGKSILQTSDGGYILTGLTASNDGDVSGNHGGPSAGYDVWVVKLNPAGNISWQKCLGGSGEDSGYKIIQTTDGGYVLVGITESNDGDVSGYHSYQDAWVVKLTSSGSISWQKPLGGYFQDWLYSVVQTADGGFILAGETQSIDGDLTGAGLHNDPGWITDEWLIKLDVSGNRVWSKCYGGMAQDASGTILQTFNNNSVPDGYLSVGWTASTDGDVSGKHGGSGQQAYDIWVIKVDLAGNLLWQKCLGGSYVDSGQSLYHTSDDCFIVAGYTKSNDGDVSGIHGGAGYNTDAWVFKMTNSGSIIWQRCYGGYWADWAQSLIQTTDNGFIFAGMTSSTDGDLAGVTTHGGQDAFIVKLSGILADPVFSPSSSISAAPVAFSVTADAGATIHYTTDGSDPTCNNGFSGTSPVNLVTPGTTGTYTYKAIACKTNWISSGIASGTYTVTGTVSDPVFTPATGSTSPNQIYFTISTPTQGALIHYTTDGSEPDCNSPLSGVSPVSLITPATPGIYSYKAIACQTNWASSEVVSCSYEITSGQIPDPVFTPSNPLPSTIPISLSIESSIPGAIIHYSTDGTIPDCNSNPFGPSPITLVTPSVPGTYQYRAIACNSGWTPSGVSGSTYVIIPVGIEPLSSPDENTVFVYPNPASGFCYVRDSGIREKEIVLYNYTGTKEFSTVSNEPAIRIDLSGYPKGIYLLKISGNDNQTGRFTTKTIKFFIEK